MHLYPAWRASHVLAVILRTPSLHKAHSNRAHLCELVHRLETLVDGHGEELGKLLVVEYLEAATRRDLADGSRVERVRMIALPALDEDCIVTQTLSKNLSPNIEEVNSFSNVPADVLDGRVAIHVGQETETEPVRGGGWISEPIHDHVASSGVESFSNPLVQFVVRNGAPVGWLCVLDLYHARG